MAVGDPKGMVPLGQAGTGRAVIFPGSGTTPLAEIQKRQARDRQEQAARQATGQQQREDLFTLSEFEVDPFEKDVEYFTNAKDQLLELGIGIQQAGIDINDLSNPSVRQLRKLENLYKTQAKVSPTQRTMYNETRKHLSENADEYLPEATAALDSWLTLPPEQRLVTPFPEVNRFWDEGSAVNKWMENYKDTDWKGWSAITNGDEFITTGSVQERTPMRAQDLGVAFYAEHPQMQSKIAGELSTMGEGDKDALRIRWANTNREREEWNAANPNSEPKRPLSIEEFHTYETRFIPKIFKKTKVDKKPISGRAGSGWDQRESADWLAKELYGISQGTTKGMQPMFTGEEASFFNSQIPGTEIDKDRYSFSSSLGDRRIGKKTEFGKTQDVVLDRIIRDNETGKWAIIESDGATTFDDASVDEKVQIIESLDWKDPQKLVTDLGTKIVRNDPEVDSGPFLKAVERNFGDINIFGDVESFGNTGGRTFPTEFERDFPTKTKKKGY